MNVRNFFRLFACDIHGHLLLIEQQQAEVLRRLHHIEERLMALNDDVTQIETNLVQLQTSISAQLTAITAEIQQVANGTADPALSARLQAVAQSLTDLNTSVVDSTNALTGDDAPVVPPPAA